MHGVQNFQNSVYAVVLNWTSDRVKTYFYLKSGEVYHQGFSRELPQTERWKKGSLGFHAEQLVIAVTFADKDVTSAYVLVLASSTSAHVNPVSVESALEEKDWLRLSSNDWSWDVQLDVSGRQVAGISPNELKVQLQVLSTCLQQHVKDLVSEKLDKALRDWEQKSIRLMSLQVLRKCKMKGEIYYPCGIRYRLLVSGNQKVWRSDIGILPMPTLGLCYAVFGL